MKNSHVERERDREAKTHYIRDDNDNHLSKKKIK